MLHISVKYSGKKGKGMRDTNMVEGCLDKGMVKLWEVMGGNGEVLGWFTSAAAAAEHVSGTVVEVDCKLKLGDTHHMEFSRDADFPPTFYTLNATRNKCAKLNKKGKEATYKKDEVVSASLHTQRGA